MGAGPRSQKDLKDTRSYEQHLGISESRMHAATATIPPLPEVPGNTGVGTREKVNPVRTDKAPLPRSRVPAQPQSLEVPRL